MSTKVIPPKELLEATIGGLSVLVVAGGADGDVLTQQIDGTYAPETPSVASGDVVGPASATDNAIVRFDATTGKLIQNSAVTVDDTGAMSVGGSSPAGKLDVIGTGYFRTSGAVNTGFYIAIAPSSVGNGRQSIYTTYAASGWECDLALGVDSNRAALVICGASGSVGASGTVGIGESTTIAAQLHVKSLNSSRIGFIVKAAASQSANLTEWQNSSGTAGAAVDKNCGCYFDYLGVGPGFCVDAVNHRVGIGTGAPAYKLHVVTPGAAGFKVQTTGGSIASPSLDFVDSTNGVELILAPNGANCAIGTYSNHPVQIVSNQQVGATVTATSTVFAGTVCANTYTVATLPSASANAYKFANVSDSLAPVIGNTVAAGGSAKAMVWSDGTNWKVCAA